MNATVPVTRRIALVTASALLGIGTLAGCSSSSQSASSPSASASPSDTASAAYCTQGEVVRASLDALVNTNVLKDGTSALKTRFATFQADVKSLEDAARANFAAETAAVEASVATLKSAMEALADSPSVAEAAALKPAIQGVATSTKALIDAVQGACASPSS